MPWKETHVMDEKIKFIAEVKKDESTIKDICEYHGISRPTGYKWIDRYEKYGIKGLEDRSRAPQNPANGLDDFVKEKILEVKHTYMHWGPKKVRSKLMKLYPEWKKHPAISSIGEFLKKEGLVITRKRRIKTMGTNKPLTIGLKPNDVWSADFKGWFKTRDGARCNPLTISDDYSRYLLSCWHVNKMNHINVQKRFEIVFREYGLPLVIRTDNGTPFASTSSYGLTKLSVWWISLGIYPERIEPGHPEQNGRHERMHRTLKDNTANPSAETINKQKKRFSEFQIEYNEERPHEALNMKTPAEFYWESSRKFPNKKPKIEYPNYMDKRKVQENGRFNYNGYELFLSESLYGEYIGIEKISEDESSLWYSNYHLGILNHRVLEIKPSKCQSLHQSGWLTLF